MKTGPIIPCELIAAQAITFSGWSWASSISRGFLSHHGRMFCLFTYLFIQKWHSSLNHMLKRILGLAVRTAENSSANAIHLFRLNTVNFCKTCTLYGNKPISSLLTRYVDDHDTPSCWASRLLEVRGSLSIAYAPPLYSRSCVRFASHQHSLLDYHAPNPWIQIFVLNAKSHSELEFYGEDIWSAF